MTEDFLHHLWKFQKFSDINFKTTNGETIRVIHQGILNYNAGADFQGAKIQIGEQLWAGAVEIHIRSSDWFKHKHDEDDTYKNVILHVVYEDDLEPENYPLEGKLPTLEIKGLFDELAYWKYKQLLGQKGSIACQQQFEHIDYMKKAQMLDRVLIERLEQKQALVLEALGYRENDWEAAFFDYTAYGFGLKVNAPTMMELARHLSPKLFNHYAAADKTLEALVYGVSGLLTEPRGDYANELSREYSFLKKKHQLSSLQPSQWKFARLMPTAFPPIRIAQWYKLWQLRGNLFSKVIQCGDISKLKALFSEKPTAYWQVHYDFDKPSSKTSGAAGNDLLERIIINVVVPFLFAYGRTKGEFFYEQRALDILDQLPAENNKITRIYKQLGLKISSAAESQAVLQWHTHYCENKKCLNCAVGNAILKI